MLDKLTGLYIDFITKFDPRTCFEDPEVLEAELPEMLYNLEAIRDNNDLDPEDLEAITAIIDEFKKAKITV